MPVYVYKNLTTGDTFEVRQPISEAALTEHPESGDPVKRIVQPVGIAFRGSGFYVNDSRSSSKGATTPAASVSSEGDGASSVTSDGAKSDSSGDASSSTSTGTSTAGSKDTKSKSASSTSKSTSTTAD